MKTIRLKSLHLVNFRGTKDRLIQFSPNDTFITGANKTGKSTVFNAFVWLLLGKDSQGRTNYNIKRIENGVELRNTDASVEGVLLVDGIEVVLKRVFVEEWSRPRGQEELRFKGNRTDYFYNGVGITQKEYKARIDEIISEQIFSLITDPEKFAMLEWKEQRQMLFNLSGGIDEEVIIKSDNRFAELLADIARRNTNLNDERKRINAERKKLRKELDDIAPRIDQTRKTMPEAMDWEALTSEKSSIEARIAEIDQLIESEGKQVQEANKSRTETLRNIASIEEQARALMEEVEAVHREKIKRIMKSVEAAEDEVKRIERARDAKATERVETLAELERKKSIREIYERDMGALREEFAKVKGEEYQGEDICSCCGQPLPEEMKLSARQKWEDSVKERLDAINARGRKMQQISKDTSEAIEGLNNKLSTLSHEIELQTQQVVTACERLDEAKRCYENRPELETPEEVRKLRLAAVNMRESLPHEIAIDTSALTNERIELRAKSLEISSKLDTKKQIDRAEAEINKLEQRASELGQSIATIERDEDTISAYTKARVLAMEERINGLFGLVTWKLFDTTNDGDEFETCIPLVDGVPYPTANTAGRVNAGLDIIRTISRIYGVSAPIFVDGRESINKVLDIGTQMIHLAVSEESTLTIK